MLKHSYNGQSSRMCLISPAGSMDPVLVALLNYSQKGKGESVIQEKDLGLLTAGGR